VQRADRLLTLATRPRNLTDICEPSAASRAVALAAVWRALLPDIAIALAALAAPIAVSSRQRPPGVDLDVGDSCLKSGAMIVSTT
jgi:hypothetical protein